MSAKETNFEHKECHPCFSPQRKKNHENRKITKPKKQQRTGRNQIKTHKTLDVPGLETAVAERQMVEKREKL